jgi:carbohydrate kinase (thermoresistant glucokinase family)
MSAGQTAGAAAGRGEHPGFPSVLLVMGVAGSGKTTVGSLLAAELGWQFRDGDSFHPASNVAKMSSGVPLTDEDRWPWLRAIRAWIDELRSAGSHGVVASSALKRSYRDLLVGKPDEAVRIVFLKGRKDLIASRMAQRRDHFMPPALLDSQFSALEEPGPDERPVTVGVEPTPDRIVEAIIARLKDPGA